MNRDQTWKNFDLGKEIDVAGTFLYNGIRCFHEMQTLTHSTEIFECLYNIAVGLERLLKVAVIFLEHDGTQDQEAFERSLITHNHLELLRRVRAKTKIDLAGPHNDFLAMLGTFYKTHRYYRFNLSKEWDPEKEKIALRTFLEKHLQVALEPVSSILPTENTLSYRKFIGSQVVSIADELYRIISDKARALNLYTWELRSDSKAAKILQKRESTFTSEDVLWKELLIYFMNTKDRSGLLDYLRSIEPLGFDKAEAPDYLQCFRMRASEL